MKLKNKEVRIEPTNLCNYDCIMCPREKLTRKKGIMSMELYYNIIDQLVEMGVERVVLTGFGEPTIDHNLELKISYAKNRGLFVYIITNASRFGLKSIFDNKFKIYEYLNRGIDEIRLSFYGKNATEYSNIMFKGDFDRIVENLELLKYYKSFFPKTVISHFLLQFNDEPINYDEYPKILRDITDYYEIWKPHNFGDGRSYRELSGGKVSCGRPQNGPLQINWDGTIVPCCYDYNNSNVLGDLNINTIEEVLKGEKYNSLRDAHNRNEYIEFPFCDNCDQLLCNKHKHSIVKTTNRHHEGLSNEEIVKRTNTDPSNSLI